MCTVYLSVVRTQNARTRTSLALCIYTSQTLFEAVLINSMHASSAAVSRAAAALPLNPAAPASCALVIVPPPIPAPARAALTTLPPPLLVPLHPALITPPPSARAPAPAAPALRGRPRATATPGAAAAPISIRTRTPRRAPAAWCALLAPTNALLSMRPPALAVALIAAAAAAALGRPPAPLAALPLLLALLLVPLPLLLLGPLLCLLIAPLELCQLLRGHQPVAAHWRRRWEAAGGRWGEPGEGFAVLAVCRGCGEPTPVDAVGVGSVVGCEVVLQDGTKGYDEEFLHVHTHARAHPLLWLFVDRVGPKQP